AYDPVSETWITKASMPTARHSPAAGVIDGILYVVGGRDNDQNWVRTLEAYDPATNTWTTKTPMPTARGHLGAGVVNGLLYAVGGAVDDFPTPPATVFAAVEAYDPLTNTWATKAPMPTPRWHLGVTVVNGVLYAVGGAGCLDGCPLATLE